MFGILYQRAYFPALKNTFIYICQLYFSQSFGGMAKQQKKKTLQQNKKLSNYIRVQNKKQQPLAPPSSNPGVKRPINDLRSFLSKEDSISPPSIQIKRSVHYYLKNITIQMLIVRCQNLKRAIQIMEKQTKISKDVIKSVLQRNFQGNSYSLWGDKYFPRNINQTLQREGFCNQIINWIKSFFHYRNTIVQESNSFIEDYQQSASCSLKKNMQELNWKLKGLIIKGRSGVGKTSLINAISKQMNYDILQCGNDKNQIKYLRQKNQATQSQSVKIKTNKHDVLMHRTNRSITQFTTVENSQKKKQGQTKKVKLQFMHNVNIFYPETDSNKFFTELNKSIQCSKIPFIMTLIGQKVPELLKGYDILEYEEAKFQKIALLIFLILHIEKNVKLNREKQIQKQKLYQEIDNQFENFHFKMLASLKQVLEVVKTFDGKIDKIFTFFHQNYSFDLSHAEKIQKTFLLAKEPYQLLQDYFYLKKQQKQQNNQNLKSDGQNDGNRQKGDTGQIDTSKYLVSFEQNFPMHTPQKTSGFQNQQKKLQKTITIKKVQDYQSSQQCKQSQDSKQQQIFSHKLETLEQRVKSLKLKVIQNQKSRLQNEQSFIFNKLSNSSGQSQQQFQQNTLDNIPIKTHFKIRNILINHLKQQYETIYQSCNLNIKAKQLCYLPMLLGVKGRSSRKQKIQTNQLSRFLNKQEIHYLNTFTKFIKCD